MPALPAQTICEVLAPHLLPARREQLEQVLRQRIVNLVVALEDVHEPQNISAVVRTCEALGIQRLLVVEGRNPYRVNKIITQGCDKWVTLIRHQTAQSALSWLRGNGYTIYASTPAADSVPLAECAPFPDRSAFFFGNEHVGLSATIRREADCRFRIPMCGFSRSLNVTVAAAMTLNQVLNSGFMPKHPEGEELWELRAEWYRRSVRKAEQILREYRERQQRKEDLSQQPGAS